MSNFTDTSSYSVVNRDEDEFQRRGVANEGYALNNVGQHGEPIRRKQLLAPSQPKYRPVKRRELVGNPVKSSLPLPLSMAHSEVGRQSTDLQGEYEEWESRHEKWNGQVYHDPLVLHGMEGGGNAAHN